MLLHNAKTLFYDYWKARDFMKLNAKAGLEWLADRATRHEIRAYKISSKSTFYRRERRKTRDSNLSNVTFEIAISICWAGLIRFYWFKNRIKLLCQLFYGGDKILKFFNEPEFYCSAKFWDFMIVYRYVQRNSLLYSRCYTDMTQPPKRKEKWEVWKFISGHKLQFSTFLTILKRRLFMTSFLCRFSGKYSNLIFKVRHKVLKSVSNKQWVE